MRRLPRHAPAATMVAQGCETRFPNQVAPFPMALRPQTVALLQAARQLVQALPADAGFLLTETDLDWDEVVDLLGPCRILVAAEDGPLARSLRGRSDLSVLDIDPGPTPTHERMSLA